MRLRHATVEDIPALHALIESAYRGDSARRGWTHEADLLDGQRTDPEDLGAMLADGKSSFIILEAPSALAGSVNVRRIEESVAYLSMLSIDPAVQAQGLGRTLIGAAERFAVEHLHASVMRMSVIAQRPELIAYYVRRGYTDTGRTEPFPKDQARFGLPRRDDLHFVILEKQLI